MTADALQTSVTRYPRRARSSRLKCISCNAPVVKTVDDGFVCVECGDSPIEVRESTGASGEREQIETGDTPEASTEAS